MIGHCSQQTSELHLQTHTMEVLGVNDDHWIYEDDAFIVNVELFLVNLTGITFIFAIGFRHFFVI